MTSGENAICSVHECGAAGACNRCGDFACELCLVRPAPPLCSACEGPEFRALLGRQERRDLVKISAIMLAVVASIMASAYLAFLLTLASANIVQAMAWVGGVLLVLSGLAIVVERLPQNRQRRLILASWLETPGRASRSFSEINDHAVLRSRMGLWLFAVLVLFIVGIGLWRGTTTARLTWWMDASLLLGFLVAVFAVTSSVRRGRGLRKKTRAEKSHRAAFSDT